jgi:hypothetical protein
MSKVMSDFEREKGLFCTPRHITRALLKREEFPGLVWEPAAGKGDIVRVLLEWGYRDVLASDIYDWGFQPCEIKDFLKSATRVGSIITNPPYDLKWQFLTQAKKLAASKIALLLPLDTEYRSPFLRYHESDAAFPWKALYAFVQGVPWANVDGTWGRFLVGWHVFERGYTGNVIREKIAFDRVPRSA